MPDFFGGDRSSRYLLGYENSSYEELYYKVNRLGIWPSDKDKQALQDEIAKALITGEINVGQHNILISYVGGRRVSSVNDYLNTYDSTGSRDFMKEHITGEDSRAGWSTRTLSSLLEKFDVSRFPDYSNVAEPYLGYIFMSRPDLNLSTENLQVLRSHRMTAAFMNDELPEELFSGDPDASSLKFGSRLMTSLSNKSKTPWLPLVTTRATSYSTTDMSIKTLDKGTTYYGHSIKYGRYSEEHKIGGTMSIEFQNDRFLSIFKMMYLWAAYIYIATRTGDISPASNYEECGVLDYPASIYFLVTRRDGRELVYWEKIVGVFPITVPFSIFNYNNDSILTDKISIDFAYGIRSDPCDPSILVDMNYLSGLDPTAIRSRMITMRELTDLNDARSKQWNDWFNKGVVWPTVEQPFAKGNALATCPFIRARRMKDGTLKYFLEFINTGKINVY